MGLLHFNYPTISPVPITSSFGHSSRSPDLLLLHLPKHPSRRRLLAVATSGGSGDATAAEEPPSIDFAFVHPRLLPDGTPDVHYRSVQGGQRLREIMLDNHIDLYGWSLVELLWRRYLWNLHGGGGRRKRVAEPEDRQGKGITQEEAQDMEISMSNYGWERRFWRTNYNPATAGVEGARMGETKGFRDELITVG